MTVTAVSFPGASLLAIALIQCTAKQFGTFCSPTDGQIKYVDPKNDDERYHSPKFTAAEAAFAYERGLIEDPANAATVDESDEDREAAANDPNEEGNAAAARTEEFAAQDAAGGDGAGTLETRSSTAWPDRDRVEGGAHGYVDGVRVAADLDTESGDDDAPPAPKAKRGAKAATAS